MEQENFIKNQYKLHWCRCIVIKIKIYKRKEDNYE